MYQPKNKLKLDIVLSGYEEDKEKIRDVVNSLQKQLNDLNRLDVGVMFGLASKSLDNLADVKNRVITTMLNTEYYTILECIDTFEIMPNYIQSLIKLIEDNYNEDEILKEHGIIKYEG
jgi:hypothetical protein